MIIALFGGMIVGLLIAAIVNARKVSKLETQISKLWTGLSITAECVDALESRIEELEAE